MSEPLIEADEPVQEESPGHRRLLFAGLGADLAAILVCAWWASRTSLGMDVNFDQLNYHYYYPWLLFHGGVGQVDPEPFTNRYVSPVAQLPWYLLDQAFSPRMSAAAIAAIAALNLALIRRITMVVLGDAVRPVSRLGLGIVAMALAGTGAVFHLSLGTSLSDVITAIPVLGALLAMLLAARDGTSQRARLWWMLLSGLLAGVALGAKLTTAPYVVGLTLAAVAFAVVRRTARPVLGLAVGGVVGVAASGGWWFAQVWHATGNPVFPYYNNIFGSSLWGDNALRDTTYGPKSVLDAMKFPYYMFEGGTRLLEYRIRDPRWVVLEVLVLLAVVLAAYLWIKRGRAAVMPRLSVVLLCIFFGVGSLAWLIQFGIARYAAPGELLTGPLFVLLLLFLLRHPVAAGVAGLVCVAAMAPFVMGRTSHVPFAADRYGVQAKLLRAIPAGSEVIADGYSAPSGFLLTYVPASSHRHVVHSWFYGSPLLEKLKRDEISVAPRIYVIRRAGWATNAPSEAIVFQREVGVRVDPTTCHRIPNHASPRVLCQGYWVG